MSRRRPRQVPEATTSTIYVLDTSVLLADPRAMYRFDEHPVVIPLVVLAELEDKRRHPDLGFTARQALRNLEALRARAGSLLEAIPVGTRGGSVRVELNHTDTARLPQGLRRDTTDHRILAVASHLAADGRPVVVVTKDLPLRLMAAVCGLEAQEYRSEQASDASWSGFANLDVDADILGELFATKHLMVPGTDEIPTHTGMVLSDGTRSALGRKHPDGRVHLIKGARQVFGIEGRSAEQRLAIDMLLDDSIGVVSLGGSAGTGKSVMAIAAGLEAVLERKTHKRIIVFRPLYAVGGQEIGFLPGTEEEKMAGPSAAVYDALDAITSSKSVVEHIIKQNLLEVSPLTNIRGRTIANAWIVVDEAQNLEKAVLVAALTRLGPGSRIVLTHDVSQRDNLRVGRYDGIVSVIEALKGNPLFAHITLTRSERSAIAEMAARLLDDPGLL